MPLNENTDITRSCIFPVQFHRNFELNVSFRFGFNDVLPMEIFFQGKFYYFVHKNVNTSCSYVRYFDFIPSTGAACIL